MNKENPTIFIVDDEPLLTEMLSDYLKEQYSGFKIRSFPTGEACLEQIDESPDAVVLDYYLNSREKDAANGIDILKENPPSMILSGQEMERAPENRTAFVKTMVDWIVQDCVTWEFKE